MRSIFNFNLGSADSIESKINAIADVLSTYSPAGTTVKRETVAKGKSCKGIISVTSCSNKNEEEICRAAPLGDCEINSGNGNPNKPTTVKYAFYASIICPSRLGSVAIYADDPAIILTVIRKRKSLFGFRVIKAVMEYGCRPFIDVTLA